MPFVREGRGVMSEWQSIETAPSGTEILLFGHSLGDPKDETICVGYWSEFDGCWNDTILGDVLNLEFTHWMPLPEPPTK